MGKCLGGSGLHSGVPWVLWRIWGWGSIASSPRLGCEAPTSTSASTPSSAASSRSVPGVRAASYLKIGWSVFPTVCLISCWGGEPAEESIEVPGSSRHVNTVEQAAFQTLFFHAGANGQQQGTCLAQPHCLGMLVFAFQGTPRSPHCPPVFAAPTVLHAQLIIANSISLNNEESCKQIVNHHL